MERQSTYSQDIRTQEAHDLAHDIRLDKLSPSVQDGVRHGRVSAYELVEARGDEHEGRTDAVVDGGLVAKLPAYDSEFYGGEEGWREKSFEERAKGDGEDDVDELEVCQMRIGRLRCRGSLRFLGHMGIL